MPPKFSISIIGLDGIEMTKKCVASVLASNNQDFQLVLTNNGSTDGTKEFFDELAAKDSRVIAIHNPDNRGFIDPNNFAFELARNAGCEFAITCNNDLTVPPNWLDEFARMFSAYPKLAVSGPQGTISNVNAQMVGNSADKYVYSEGSNMAVRISALPTDEPLFAKYLTFIYFDDLELSLRLQRRGWECRQANFRVAHRNGSTCTRHPDAIRKCREAMNLNQKVMLKRWAHWNKVRRFNFQIVVKRTFASGDILLMTPIVRALKELWPLCPIDVECGVPEIFKGNPHVRKCARRIHPEPTAMVVNLDNSYERTPRRHVLESYAEVAGLDADKVNFKCELFHDPALYQKLPPMENGMWVAVHVGPTTWPGKNWPMERWRDVIQAIRSQGNRVILFGNKSRDDFGLVDCDMRGQNGVHECASLIGQCDLFVGLNSFPMHVAQAVGVPVVALFGITNPACFLTKGSEAIACTSAKEHVNTGRRNKVANITFLNTDDSVMRTITVQQVLAAVTEMTTEKAVRGYMGDTANTPFGPHD